MFYSIFLCQLVLFNLQITALNRAESTKVTALERMNISISTLKALKYMRKNISQAKVELNTIIVVFVVHAILYTSSTVYSDTN